eukprot:TRINITY_DN12510_c0_g1_i1.p1 TRINITY_DN12510_c0_g1~~TRINITY_DN12510_c0_g1_i1.p1  ORF type:complete len:311 (+),score=80.51 TRINITY_DN12510_c0_g1_i1:128-1060(+)
MLCPPEVFGIVEAGIYRSNSLSPINFTFIKTLNLKTVVQLSPEVPIKPVTTFLQENNIALHHLGLKEWNPDVTWRPVTDELIKEALELALNVDNHPIMVMCTSGIHQTGTLVGCLRVLQHWNLTSILVEYRNMSVKHSTRFGDEQYIELFDADLVTLPPRLPDWFRLQRRMMEEEEDQLALAKAAAKGLPTAAPSKPVPKAAGVSNGGSQSFASPVKKKRHKDSANAAVASDGSQTAPETRQPPTPKRATSTVNVKETGSDSKDTKRAMSAANLKEHVADSKDPKRNEEHAESANSADTRQRKGSDLRKQ